jgi:hypothetical protein
MFDIDSIMGYPTSLAVAKQGIRWHPSQMVVSDLQSSLHLNTVPVHYEDQHGHAHTVRRPVHQLPHYTFGRLMGFEDVSLYLLFPHLYREEQQCGRLQDHDFKTWMDQVLLPAIYQHHPSSVAQHYPSSYDHSRSSATARGVELRSQRIDATAREQLLFYFLPPDSLHQIWETILDTVEKPGLRQFRGLRILLQAKNLKTLTKDHTWQAMTERFYKYWNHGVLDSYTTSEFYFDIGKEVCPSALSSVIMGEGPSSPDCESHVSSDMQSLLWKRCCLDSYATWIQDAHGPVNDGHQKVFYPTSMLHDSGSLTIETNSSSCRRAGLLYSQFYSSIKEVFAAGNVYTFTNTALETLALDPKLCKTWQHVGGGLSYDPVALIRAYLYTKRRCHHALQGCEQKSFGIREEHRVSRSLFDQIDQEFQRRNLHTQDLVASPWDNTPYYHHPTRTMVEWLHWNINKFCVGFETVYSMNDHHFVTWEHTHVMLMFLRCLQFSYSSGLIQRAGGCWHDIKYQPDANQPDGLWRWEGLGFRDTMQQ